MQSEKRGRVLKIAVVERYPNDEIKLIPITIDPEVKLIMFNPEAIEQRLNQLGVAMSEWNTGKWEDNPSILIERTDGVVILYTKYSGHQHQDGHCKAMGTIVHPKGATITGNAVTTRF